MTDRYFKLGDTVTEERFIANNSPERWSLVAVIDPSDRAAVERLIRLQVGASAGCPDALEVSEKQIDRMQAALREFAAPTPPKPEEPTGLGAVVELVKPPAYEWAKAVHTGGGHWVFSDSSGNGGPTRWEHLNVVRVVHEGVTA